jgi:hypothetical protein
LRQYRNQFRAILSCADHGQQVVGQGTHLQPGLVGLETVAAGLVPEQGVVHGQPDEASDALTALKTKRRKSGPHSC